MRVKGSSSCAMRSGKGAGRVNDGIELKVRDLFWSRSAFIVQNLPCAYPSGVLFVSIGCVAYVHVFSVFAVYCSSFLVAFMRLRQLTSNNSSS